MSDSDDDSSRGAPPPPPPARRRRGGAGGAGGSSSDDDQQQDQHQQQDQQQRATRIPIADADDDTLRIMLSTDNHLGYNERDPIRGMDSFAAFEEVLYLSKKFQCDMVLIAGDLFHDNRPSRRTLHKTMEIIRRYCMGPNPVRIQILSDQAKNFRNAVTNCVNYQDEYYSVDLPVFSIHGNHDDPSRDTGGGELLAALDLLSVSNLVNYFGRNEEIDKVQVSPVLIQKGTTKVAMYGMGSMRDERLNRMWSQKKVRFLKPEDNNNNDDDSDDDEDDDDGFFNLFTLHQNRDLGRGTKNCVQESMIPEWMDVVVWGHEHECLIEFFESVVGTFRITQPGSSVATSLVAGEAVRKRVGVLDIKGKNYRLHPIPLTNVRGFVTSELSLKEHKADLDPEDHKIDTKITKILDDEVRLLVMNAHDRMKEVLEEARAAGNDAGDEGSPIKYHLNKPDDVLVRIRVEHSGFTTLNNQRFGAKFVQKNVANPTDILLFHRRKEPKPTAGTTKKKRSGSVLDEPIVPEELERTNMEDLLVQYLDAPDRKLTLLDQDKLNEALDEYVEKSNTSIIHDTTTRLLKKRQTMLEKRAKNDEADGFDKAAQIRKIVEHDIEREREKKNKKKRKSKDGEEGEDDGGDDGGDNEQDAAAAGSDDEDEEIDESFDDDAGKENERAAAAKNKRKKPRASSSSASSAASSRQRGSSSAAARRQEAMDEDNDDDDDDDIMEVVDRGSKKKKATKSKSSSSAATSRGGGGSRRQQKKPKSYMEDSDDDDDDEIEVVEQRPSKRATSKRTATRRPVRYNLDDSDDDEDDYRQHDDDDDDDDDLEVDEPPKKKRASAASSKKKKATAAKSSKSTTLSGRARSSASSTTGKRGRGGGRNTSRLADSDSDGGGGGGASHGASYASAIDLDEDWGTAATRSQY